MVRSHHPVLAVISNCYSEPKGRFPRVTHPCATRPEGLVRLACVRHAASVRSEPGSNSQVVVIASFRTQAISPGNPNKTKLREPMPAFVKRNGYEGHTNNGLFYTASRSPKTPRRRRRRPHVPSSINNVKEPQTTDGGQSSSPDFLFRGGDCPSMFATNLAETRSKPGHSVSVKPHIWTLLHTVNEILHFF